ncbi:MULTISPECIES: RNase adapter RapZ [unclassified Fusibacter]|uniref:RNase adapter RapZ n=1 Tax=unclassified Fusibacter TaxID=2624464 RepID=UPI0010113322|nr:MULTISPECIES: RNase adapter RapZ [unclassified Fusibacter]MCK8061037.1 RNase adapter RapZ [Fusibacter sp. A2]NPE20509.1 RNase adapter RapZ [Fusibacter sp. A1]RXV63709.1 RNase adapter RapZ [Fusibacter sp. A1]
MDIKIITGLSGAGKSTVIKSLEDMGYYCIDNLPPALMTQFVTMCEQLKDPIDKIAIGVDIRGRSFFDSFESDIEDFLALYPRCQVVFLDASDKALIDRFKETRRTHPLNPEGSIMDGINMERDKMHRLKSKAFIVLDTSHMNGRTLGLTIKKQFLGEAAAKQIAITFQSFGFKKGIPMDSDLVFDVRFLPNPYYDEALRPLSGNDTEIQEYVFKWDETKTFYKKLKDLLDFLVPQYIREGKNQVIVAIGCTGGRHRSVSIANKLASDFESEHYVSTVKHRDLK